MSEIRIGRSGRRAAAGRASIRTQLIRHPNAGYFSVISCSDYSSVLASLNLRLAPVFAVLGVATLLGEDLASGTGLGCVMMLVAMALAHRLPSDKKVTVMGIMAVIVYSFSDP